jgi:hypothetical protein
MRIRTSEAEKWSATAGQLPIPFCRCCAIVAICLTAGQTLDYNGRYLQRSQAQESRLLIRHGENADRAAAAPHQKIEIIK